MRLDLAADLLLSGQDRLRRASQAKRLPNTVPGESYISARCASI